MNELKNKEYQYSEILNISENESPKEKSLKTIILIIVSAFLVILLCLIIVSTLFFSDGKLKTELENNPLLAKFVKKENTSTNIFSKRQNILLLGVDSNGDETDPFLNTRSDTILVMNIDPKNRTVNAISIPRDSKVYLAENKGIQKINHAHAIGGIHLLKRTIEETLGIKIDRYVIVNAAGVRDLVNILGGIPIFVEKPLKYNDNAGKLHINLDKGFQVLNGKQAEGFLRYRHDGMGDIGRTSRQQLFLRSLLEKLQTPQAVYKIPEVLKVILNYVKTDMSLYELSHLAAMMRNIDMDTIEVATLPGGPSTKGTISYWILDPEKTQEVIDRLIYREKIIEAEGLKAGVVYIKGHKEEAQEIQSSLEELGYEIKCMTQTHATHSQIIAHKQEVGSEFVSKLKRKIPITRKMPFVFDTNKNYCAESDFTIVISDN